jgi:hypothetical protein
MFSSISCRQPLCIRKSSDEVMVAGFAAPEFRGKGVKKILVHARIDNIFFRDRVERKLAEEITDESDRRTTGVAALVLIPPIKEYTEQEIDQALSSEKIDAVIFITVTDATTYTSSGWGFSVSRGWRGASGSAGLLQES